MRGSILSKLAVAFIELMDKANISYINWVMKHRGPMSIDRMAVWIKHAGTLLRSDIISNLLLKQIIFMDCH